MESGTSRLAAEVKSGRTIASDFFAALEELRGLLASSQPPRSLRARLVYGGEAAQKRRRVEVVPWNRVADTAW